jgi:hypothetical protein
LVSLLGGWPGALVAQKVFRHKTQKVAFQRVFWVAVVVNLGVLGWVVSNPGKDSLKISNLIPENRSISAFYAPNRNLL